MLPTSALSVTGLRKQYNGRDAVRGISFEIDTGEIFGLLGPNGAGKTTTLECILGLRQPDGGVILINGEDPRHHPSRSKRSVGAQLQGAMLQDKITPRMALRLFGSFYDQPLPAEELLARFHLDEKSDAPFATLSSGQKQRLFLALALIHHPALLMLDEPTAGLDPQSRRELHALICEIRSEGRTVLLSTHDLDEAGQLCDRIGIMDAGRLVEVAPPGEMISRSRAPARLIVRTAPPMEAGLVETLPHLAGATFGDHGWILETREPNRVLAGLVRLLDDAGIELLDVEMRRPSLEDVFIELTGRSWSGQDSTAEAS